MSQVAGHTSQVACRRSHVAAGRMSQVAAGRMSQQVACRTLQVASYRLQADRGRGRMALS
jgi:hypothetical protein